jgi:hypothetical protein
VETATFANGAKRYGFDDVIEQLMTGMFAAAGHCHRCRLPEVLAGHDRSDTGVPTTYPNAKSPQAWSASATISLVQHAAGLLPFAPNRMLGLVRPSLPAWLPELTLRRVRVGDARVDLRFERQRDGSTAHEVLATDGRVRVSQVPPPNAEPQGLGERTARAMMTVAPGRTAKAGRIAAGIESG